MSTRQEPGLHAHMPTRQAQMCASDGSYWYQWGCVHVTHTQPLQSRKNAEATETSEQAYNHLGLLTAWRTEGLLVASSPARTNGEKGHVHKSLARAMRGSSFAASHHSHASVCRMDSTRISSTSHCCSANMSWTTQTHY